MSKELTAKDVVKKWALRDETAERYPHLRAALDVLIWEFEQQGHAIEVYQARIQELESERRA